MFMFANIRDFGELFKSNVKQFTLAFDEQLNRL